MNEIWSEHKFIRHLDISHFQTDFVRIKLGPTKILIWYQSQSKINWPARYHYWATQGT